MNIAFPALVVFVLLMPGVVFRSAYFKGFWKTPFRLGTWAEEIGYGVPYAFAFHAALCLAIKVLDWLPEPNYRVLSMLLLGNFGKDSNALPEVIESISTSTGWIASYFILANLLAWVLGKLAWKVVTDLRLDVRYSQFFQFENEWYYKLRSVDSSGELGISGERVVEAAIVLEQGKEAHIYKGIVEDWSFTKTGELEMLYLSGVRRRKLDADWQSEDPKPQTGDARYYEVDGDLFAVRFSDITSLNLLYRNFDLATDSPDESDEPQPPPAGT